MDQTKLILEGIATRRCVTATYNKSSITMAPHILYTRHGEMYVDGVTLERDGKPPREIKLGTFKLTGLQITGPVGKAFTPEAFFDPADPKYEGVTLLAV
jgi:hypothetical protein